MPRGVPLALVVLLAAPLRAEDGDAWTETVRLQVALDRLGFSPGLIDGSAGRKTALALAALARARGVASLAPEDVVPADLPATSPYVIAHEDTTLIGHVPQDWNERANLEAMTYESMIDLLAERGHCTVAAVRRLNPDVDFDRLRAGDSVALPAVLPEPAAPAPAASLVVDLEAKTVTARDAKGTPIALFHCSIAANVEKRPKGATAVKAVAMDPDYTFDPEKWPEVKDVDHKLRIPPGPRNPVGLAWIGLELPGYGIHGTAWPELIGKTGSHGCIRLANWDAVRLAHLIGVGTPVEFVDAAGR